MSVIAKALAVLRCPRGHPLVKEVARLAEANVADYRPDEISNLLYGLSHLRYSDMQVYYACVRQCIRILEDPAHPYADRRWMNYQVHGQEGRLARCVD